MDSSIVKANDIRGKIPDEWDVNDAYRIGKGFATVLKQCELKKAIIGRDARLYGLEIKDALIRALTEDGISVLDIDLCSTDQVSLFSGIYDLPAVMITASHNPKEYNGLKFMFSGALPIGRQNGLDDIIESATKKTTNNEKIEGKIEKLNTLNLYSNELLNAIKGVKDVSKMKIVVDAGNGMGGLIVSKVFDFIKNVEIVEMFFELDGTFPNHQPNPLNPENLIELQKKVVKEKADLGLAFDGDGDRCFMIDENGKVINPSSIICAIGNEKVKYLLKRNKRTKPTVIRNLITSRAVDKSIKKSGGKTVVSKVGHSFIKLDMRKYQAIFGGEHSAHYYFKEFYFADSGLLAALNFIKILFDYKIKASEIDKKYSSYYQSGEINLNVKKVNKVLKKLEKKYDRKFEINHLDGLTIADWKKKPKAKKWWINVRPSNTEPLLRVNIEAGSVTTLNKIKKEIIDSINSI